MRENTCVRVFCSHTSACYSGSQSTVNETNCDKKREIRAKKMCELTSNSIRFRATTRNLKLKVNTDILNVDQFERWTGNLLRNVLVLVVCVFADLDGWALQLVLLIRGVSDFFIMTAAL